MPRPGERAAWTPVSLLRAPTADGPAADRLELQVDDGSAACLVNGQRAAAVSIVAGEVDGSPGMHVGAGGDVLVTLFAVEGSPSFVRQPIDARYSAPESSIAPTLARSALAADSSAASSPKMTQKNHAHIVAKLTLFPTDQGGRQGSTPPHVFLVPFVYEGEQFNCGLLLDDSGPLRPGTQAIVPIQFLRPELIVPRLREGSRFQLWEMRSIAEGVVLEILRSV